MATDRTKLTELATAAGLVWDSGGSWPASLESLTVPGIDDEVWKPVVLPATATAHRDRDLLLRALDNGHAFRHVVLRGREPERVEWSANRHAPWTSDVPRDLTIDGVWFVQAKYDSTCVLNTAPATLVDELLADDAPGNRPSWYEEVAPHALGTYWKAVRAACRAEADAEDLDLPADVRDLDATHRAFLKRAMRRRDATAAEDREYLELSRAVSVETANRWRRRLAAATVAQQTQMLFRMLRIAGGPYWLLGTKGSHPVRLAVADTRSWRDRFTLRKLTVGDGHAGQPQVNWRAEITEAASGDRHAVEGYCEIRWSHGKLQGHPECKVQVTTPLEAIPGYGPMI